MWVLKYLWLFTRKSGFGWPNRTKKKKWTRFEKSFVCFPANANEKSFERKQQYLSIEFSCIQHRTYRIRTDGYWIYIVQLSAVRSLTMNSDNMSSLSLSHMHTHHRQRFMVCFASFHFKSISTDTQCPAAAETYPVPTIPLYVPIGVRYFFFYPTTGIDRHTTKIPHIFHIYSNIFPQI